MMATRSLNVVVSGDVSKLKGAFRRGGDEAEKFSKKTREASDRTAEGFKKIHEASKLLLEIGGLSSLAFGIKDVTEEAVKAEAEQKKLAATVKGAGLSWRAHGKDIDEWLDKTSRASGFVKSDLTNSLSNLIRVTGSVSKARKLESEAMDVSRARGTSLASAQQLLARVYAGSFTSLQRLGIPVKAITTAQDKLKETTKHATTEQVAHAKALDKQASVTSALGLVQDKFGGQSKAFASSTAGSFERARASLNLFEEQVGKVVLPILAKAASAIADLAAKAQQDWPQIKAIALQVFGKVRPVIDATRTAIAGLLTHFKALVKGFQAGKGGAVAIVSVIAGLAAGVLTAIAVIKTITAVTKAWTAVQAALDVVLSANPIGLIIVALAGLAAGLVIAYKKSQTFRNIVNGTWNAIKSVAETVFPIIKKMMQLGLLGPIGLAITHFGTIKRVAVDAFNAIKSAINGVISAVKSVSGAFKTVTGVVGKVAGALNPFGDGLGRAAGNLSLPSGGAFGGSLMGARPSLRPFAAVGSRFGLHVTDGKRPAGTTTVSGGVSYHSTGEAIDMGDGRGPDSNKLAYFKYMKSRFGGRLAELIYTPGGAGIKDGRPFNYTGAVAAEHYDHVHVAFDSGVPGVGDGPGRPRGRYAGDGIGFTATAKLAESVGLPGVTFAQIAHGESTYDPKAIGHDPGGTTGYGLFQITSGYNDDIIAKYGGPHALLNAHTNALAARDVWRRQGPSAWHGTKYVTGWNLHYGGGKGGSSGSGASAVRLTPGQKRARGQFGASQGSARGQARSEVAESRAEAANRSLIGPGQGGYGQKIDDAELGQATARSKDNLGGLIRALQSELGLKLKRLKKIRKALKRRLKPATRKALTEEATTLIGEVGDLQDTLKEYQADQKGGATTITQADALDAGVAPDTGSSGGTDTGAGTDAGSDSSALISAIADLKASIDAQTKFATDVANTSNYQLTKNLADTLSGHIVGYGVAGRAFTPGVGTEHAY
jgi:hypothetical protein